VRISRIQVEEGFLDGLDLSLSDGLNVVFGPRGSGKTSLIQTIRFGLGAGSYSDESAAAARKHALATLGSGEVTITLTDGRSQVSVSRSAEDEAPRSDGPVPEITVLGPNEIESISLSPVGRLRLLDTFRADREEYSAREAQLRSALRTLTRQVAQAARELREFEEAAGGIDVVTDELATATARQEALLQDIEASARDRRSLQELHRRGAQLGVQASVVDRARSSIDQWTTVLEDVLHDAPSAGSWPPEGGDRDLLESTRTDLSSASALIQQAVGILRRSSASLMSQNKELTSQQIATDQGSRELRKKLDTIQQGAGAVAQRVGALQQQLERLRATDAARADRAAHLEQLVAKRGGLFDEWEAIRDARFRSRERVATELNEELGPTIQVEVTKASIISEYLEAIAGGLRGSGLHQADLPRLIAARMSPRELAEAVETGDASLVSDATGLKPDRASRIVDHLRSQGTEEIATTRIEDGVSLRLLDGTEYKATPDLSTGQRCTIVLPLLLSHETGVLVVDQPEDNLDNAFVATTVVPALKRRKTDSQLLFTTHNANIPVLAEADRVIQVGSDGRRGFVRHAGDLDDARSVRGITDVMEGGRAAFQMRQAFYENEWQQGE
jgi:ABC-type lipoprotein export system ATPase subunit